MDEVLSSSVLLISENPQDRKFLRAQLDLMGLWGRVVEAETFINAQQLTASQQPQLCVWRMPDDKYNHEAFLKLKKQLGQHLILLGDKKYASLFANERFLSIPHIFRDLQNHIRATILPQHIPDALRGREVAPGDQERIYRDLFDRGSDANLLLDAETHIIIDANQRALEMYGVTQDEIIGMNMLELVTDLEHPNMWRDTQFLQKSKGEPVFVERVDKKKDGSHMHVTVSGSLFEFAGRMIFQDIIRDETGRRLSEQRRIELRIERERVKTLHQFISDATHDLMTPLTIIKTELYLADKSPDEEKRKQKMESIGNQVQHLQQKIEDMITIARLDATTSEQLVMKQTDLNKLVQTLVENYQPILRKHGHTLTAHLPSMSTYLTIDIEHIGMAISKLLDNAIHYTSREGYIDVSVESNDEFVYLSVTDNGVGIAADEQNLIFDRFYRIEQHRPSGGSGLGLAIAKSIVELHHGYIEVISNKGVGSTFKILLPQLDLNPKK